MKTLTMTAVIALATTLSFNAMAETTVKKSVVLNNSANKGNATVAVGKDNIASTGSVNLKDTKVKKSVILNNTRNEGNATVSFGEGNTSSTGSVTSE